MEDYRLKRALIFLPMAVLIGLLLSSPQEALATDPQLDGGGFPTRTPTPTRVKIPLPSRTGASLPTLTLFPASATPSQGEGLFLQGQQPPAANAPTQPSQPFSLLACWPFALVVILLLLVGVMWLSSRLRQNTV